jgi:hypothetical protein
LSEDILQAEIYKWYKNNYCLIHHQPRHSIFSVPNGGLRSKKEAMKLKATGVVAGVSDLIVVQPDRVVFVELKTPTGRQSPEQIEFEKTVTSLGFEYMLVRSLEEFQEKIKKNQ